MSKQFVHLHVHSDYSMLDGKGLIPRYVQKAKKLSMPAISLTDHGNLSGAPEFYWECKAEGIRPIVGEEFYFVEDAEASKNDKNAERFHVVILARNEDGYKTLVELSTEAHRRFYYKPVIDRGLLEALGSRSKDLVALSGCAGSIVSRKAAGAIPGDALEEMEWWKNLFPNFYVELQNHGCKGDRKLNKELIRAARTLELPLVITNDPHYVEKEEAPYHDALLAIQTGSDIDDPNRFKFDGSGYHLKSRSEMFKAFSSYPHEIWKEGAGNTLRIAEQCNLSIGAWENRTWHIPAYKPGSDSFKILRKLAWKELKERGLDSKLYTRRLKHELRKIRETGISDVLLVTRAAIRWASRRGIRVGPGRGSVAGCFVAFLLGIHKVDSVKYNLLFERFLNPERPKMPDIDTDFPPSRREELFKYVEKTYGAENIMHVAAFQTMQVKSAFKSLAKAHGISFQEANLLSKKIIEDESGVHLPNKIQEGYPGLYETLMAIRGVKKSIGKHPAGTIIFSKDDPVRQLIPEAWIVSAKDFVSQFDLDACSEIRLFKNDFLGLRTLDTIQECVQMVQERHGVEIEPDQWVPDEEEHDAKVYKMLADGKVNGVFQMEGGTNSRGIVAMKCSRFEDIVACTSLYRAGPLDAGADNRYLKNKKDGKVRVAHPSLKTFLKDTWGEMIYQEQMFEILFNLAGFSWSRVDDAKTAMTKKDAAKMAALKDEAIAGFRKIAGMPPDAADKVWEMIAAQATYLFNRSHAVAYSLLSYQTARLKYLYPLEYFAALLKTVKPSSKENKERRQVYMAEAVKWGFRIKPPDINLSDITFKSEGKKSLRFGLTDIKGIGEKAGIRIIENRPRKGFKTFAEVELAANNKGVMKSLVAAGALKSFKIKTTPEDQEEALSWRFKDEMFQYRNQYEDKVVFPGDNGAPVVLLGEIVKTERRQTKNGKPFMTWVIRWDQATSFNVTLWDGTNNLWNLPKGSIVGVKGKWNTEFQNVAVGDSSQVGVIK